MKKYSWLIGLVAVAVVAAGVVYWQRSDPQKALEREVAAANYCTEDADCEVVTGACPLGCWFAVNKAEAGRIQSRMDEFQAQSTCTYSCIALEGVTCVSGKCEVRTPQP